MAKVRLGDVAREYKATIKNGAGLPVVGLEHLTPGEITLEHWDVDTENTFTKGFKKGHMLFGRRRAYLKKAALAPFDGICSGDITVIEAIPGKINPELLPFIIQNDLLFDYAVGNSAGSLSPRVKWDSLKDYQFELPELEKQDGLVELLKAAHRTKAAYRQQIIATDELVKSQFIEMFYGREYPMRTIGQVVDRTVLRASKKFAKDDIIEYLDISSIDNSSKTVTGTTTYTLSEAPSRAQYVLQKDDILYSTVRPNLQNIAVNPYSANNIIGSTGFCVLRCREVSKGFMWGLITSDQFTDKMVSLASGANYPAVTDKVVYEFDFPMPPYEEQMRFERLVEQSDKSKFVVSNQNYLV